MPPPFILTRLSSVFLLSWPRGFATLTCNHHVGNLDFLDTLGTFARSIRPAAACLQRHLNKRLGPGISALCQDEAKTVEWPRLPGIRKLELSDSLQADLHGACTWGVAAVFSRPCHRSLCGPATAFGHRLIKAPSSPRNPSDRAPGRWPRVPAGYRCRPWREQPPADP